MNQNSQPPSGDAPERPTGERPWPEQPSQPPQQPQQPPGAYAPPPSQAYPGQGPAQQPGYPPSGAPPGRPQDAPPPGYQPQGYPPPGYTQPPGAGGAPPPWNYPPPGPPQGYPPPGYREEPRRSSGMPTWAWVVIGLVVVLIISCVGVIAALSYLGTQVSKSFSTIGAGLMESFEPMTVASEFYTYLATKDYDSAHELLSSDLAFKYTSGDLQLKWDALESGHGTITPGFPSTHGGSFTKSSNKNSVTLDQELTSSSGKVYIITLTMQKSGNTWVIQDASPGLIPEP